MSEPNHICHSDRTGTQLYDACRSAKTTDQQGPQSHRRESWLSVCVDDVAVSSWMSANRLQLNAAKTEQASISKVVAGAVSRVATLRQLRSIHRSLTQATLTRLVVSLVLTRVDYCNAVLTGLGLPSTQLHRLQSVINAAAHLILSGRRRDHIVT